MPLFLAAKLFGAPRWLWLAGAILAAVAAIIVGMKVHDARIAREAVAADVGEANAAAVATARQADERAHEAVQATHDTIQKENADAKAAADSGDDPLADALRSLRGSGARRGN